MAQQSENLAELSDKGLQLRSQVADVLTKGAWFHGRNFENLLRLLRIPTSIAAPLVQPVTTLYHLHGSDYDGFIKCALAHWIRRNAATATVSQLVVLLGDGGYREAADAIHRIASPRKVAHDYKELTTYLRVAKKGDSLELVPHQNYVGCFIVAHDNVNIIGNNGILTALDQSSQTALHIQANGCVIETLTIVSKNNGLQLNGDATTLRKLKLISTYSSQKVGNAIKIVGYGNVTSRLEVVGFSMGLVIHGDFNKCSKTVIAESSTCIEIKGSNNVISEAKLDKCTQGLRIEKGRLNVIEDVNAISNCSPGPVLFVGDETSDLTMFNSSFDVIVPGSWMQAVIRGALGGIINVVRGKGHRFTNVNFGRSVDIDGLSHRVENCKVKTLLRGPEPTALVEISCKFDSRAYNRWV